MNLDDIQPLMLQREGCYQPGDLVRLPNGGAAQIESVDAENQTMQLVPLGVDADDVDKAANDFSMFAGKAPDTIEGFDPKVLSGAGWGLGKLVGVLYEAEVVNEGEGKLRFFHQFRPSSRPTLVVLDDGKTLATVGGKFQVTDRGIEDR